MADINANFEYDADFGPAIAQVRSLAREISLLNNSFNSLDKAALTAKKSLATSFQRDVASLGMFQTTVVDLSSDVDRFGEALQKNKLHMRDYFKEARRAYTEGSRVRKLAVEQVRKAQSEILSLGKDSTGRNKGMILTPLSIDTKNMQNSMAIAREQFNIFNKLVQDGSRELINWGKNTQWAGRQLTVGLTVPLTLFGTTLSRTFRDFDKELTRFQKVYGSDLVNTTTQASTEMRKQVELLAKDIAGKFGIAVSETAALAADLAATGLEGQKLTDSIQQTTRLAVLGEVDRQEAMKATLALQNAFNMSTQELADSINFLNAVENQTSVSISDLTEAIPRTGPVINALGGDVKDLSVLLVAMKEGGISAAEGANAIKSGMASLINPTKQAAATAKGFGIDLEGIVTRNKGKLMPTILEFQGALQGLDEFARAQIIEQVFGKYQFARIAALFDNLNQSGSQTVEVIKLMSASSTDLANVANQELRTLTESTSMRFQRAMESIKAAMLPIGETLTRSVIPFLEKAADLFNKLVEFGQGLPEPVKNFIKLATGITAIAGPLVMITGVLANFLGYVTKGAMGIINLGRAVAGIPTKQFELLNDEQIVALKTTDLLTAAYTKQDQALSKLNGTMAAHIAALRTQASTNPQQFLPGSPARPVKRATGGGVPGVGNTDSVPALLMPGEFVMNKKATEKYGPIINAMNEGTIKGFAKAGGVGDVDFSKSDIARSHAGSSMSPETRLLAIQNAGLADLMPKFDDFINVVSNLTAELPKELNKAMMVVRKTDKQGNLIKDENGNIVYQNRGVSADVFERGYGSRQDIFKASAARGGLDIQEQSNIDALRQFEKEVGKRTLEIARSTGAQKINDAHLEKATLQIIDEYKKVSGASSRVAQALDKVAKEGSAIRLQIPAAKVRAGIASGEFAQQGRNVVLASSPNTVVAESRREGSSRGGYNPPQFGRSGSYTSAPLMSSVSASGQALGAAAVAGAAKGARTKSPSEATIDIGNDIGRGLVIGMNEQLDDVSNAGQQMGQTPLTGIQKAKQRASTIGRGLVSRGASASGGLFGASIALNSVSAMNEGFASATKGLTDFTNKLLLASSALQIMQMFQGGPGMLTGLGGRMKGVGGKLSGAGSQMALRGGMTKALSGGSKVALAQGAARLGGGALLQGAGSTLALLGGPAGIAALAAIAAITYGVAKYKQSITEARKEGEAMYASQTKAAEYYGITLKDVNAQMKANAEISKTLGFNPGPGTAQGVDPALKKAILEQEDNKKLVEQIKASNDPSSLFLGQYGKMLQQGFSADQAKEVLSVIAQASGKTGQLLGMSKTFAGITTAQQATSAVGTSFTGNLKGIFGTTSGAASTTGMNGIAYGAGGRAGMYGGAGGGAVSAQDLAKLQGAFTGVLNAALTSPDLGQGMAVLKNSVQTAFVQGAKAGVSAKDIGGQLDKSIKATLGEMGIEKGTPIYDMIDRLDESAGDTNKKLLLVQATAANIDLSGFLADGKLAQSEIDQINMKLAQMDAAAQIDLKLDTQLQKEIDTLNEVKNAQISRYDNLIAKNEAAKTKEEDRHKNFQKNIDKENKSLDKRIKAIQKGSDEYIKALDEEAKADEFRQKQRQTALGGLEALAGGDVFGFIQAQQDMAANAVNAGRDSEIEKIKNQSQDAVDKLQSQIDKNNELADGEDERFANRMQQLDDENTKIQRNKASTIQSIDAAIAQAQKLKDLKPGEALSGDMSKYVSAMSSLAEKLPPEAQKIVSTLASSFKNDFTKIVDGAITSAGAEYGITDTSKLKSLMTSALNKDMYKSLVGTGFKGVGAVGGYATGGYVSGPGGPRSDMINAKLSNGEYVVNADAVNSYGVGMLNSINAKKFADGGYVGEAGRSAETATGIGVGLVTDFALKSAVGSVLTDILGQDEPENDNGAPTSSAVANYKLLGEVAKILMGAARVTARQVYPSSGNRHSARYPGRAVDYGVGRGTSVYAMAGGTASIHDLGSRSYGKYVSVKHDDGTESIYAHLDSFAGATGRVRAGQKIGYSGTSGNSSGYHLHFEWSGLKPGSNPPGMRAGGETLSNGLAMLHQGEAVLTSPLTADLKAGIEAMKYNVPQQMPVGIEGSIISNNVQYNININGTNTDNPREIANQVVKAIKVEDSRRNFSRRVK